MKKRTTKKNTPAKRKAVSVVVERIPKCHLAVAKYGLETGAGVSRVLAALIHDITGGTIDARQANAINNSIGKLIKNYEASHKYGQPTQKSKRLSGIKYVE